MYFSRENGLNSKYTSGHFLKKLEMFINTLSGRCNEFILQNINLKRFVAFETPTTPKKHKFGALDIRVLQKITTKIFHGVTKSENLYHVAILFEYKVVMSPKKLNT